MSKSPAVDKKHDPFSDLVCIYGRKAVLEALQSDLEAFRLHLAHSNKKADILDAILTLAEQRNIEIRYHDKRKLSFISKNARQDQGVALDIRCPTHHLFDDWLKRMPAGKLRLLALDAIHNPQNLGMIIRSATAAGVDGILYAARGTAALGPLVIKASAGALFKASLIRCTSLEQALQTLTEQGVELALLDAQAADSLFDFKPEKSCCFILGNESSGIDPAIYSLPHRAMSLPMNNGVESLNVAVSAALVSYLICFQDS